jgi:hypothetical protein
VRPKGDGRSTVPDSHLHPRIAAGCGPQSSPEHDPHQRTRHDQHNPVDQEHRHFEGDQIMPQKGKDHELFTARTKPKTNSPRIARSAFPPAITGCSTLY